MVTVLDCIQRIPSIMERILTNRKETTRPLLDFLGDRLNRIDELVFIGSGTSNTSAWTSRTAAAHLARIRVSTIVPNEFLFENPRLNPNALYLFTSQSGNSILTRQCMRNLKTAGYLTCGITEGASTDIGKEAGVHVDMGCGHEEFGCRTIGFCASILTHLVIALEIGLASGRLSQAEYDSYLADAAKVPASQKAITDKALAWYDANEAALTSCDSYVFYGAGSLWGVALEGALKVMEMPRKIAIGYELEDGLHGPTMAFGKSTCVVALDGGDPGSEKAIGCGGMAKEQSQGFVFGGKGIDAQDLPFESVGGEFRGLEFAPAVQVLAYRLSASAGIDLAVPPPLPKKEFFALHDEP